MVYMHHFASHIQLFNMLTYDKFRIFAYLWLCCNLAGEHKTYTNFVMDVSLYISRLFQ